MADNIPATIPAGRCALCRRLWTAHRTYQVRDWTDYVCDSLNCDLCGRSMRVGESTGKDRWIWRCVACGLTKRLTDKQKQEDRQ